MDWWPGEAIGCSLGFTLTELIVATAIAAYDARLVGNSHFSYDEAMADYNIGTAGYVVDEWAELAGVSMPLFSLDMAKYGL